MLSKLLFFLRAGGGSRLLSFGVCACVFISFQSIALVNTITITATVASQPCTVNNGNPIDVDFGDSLSAKKLDGEHYIKNIDYSLDCSNASSSNLKLEFSGVGADFDSSVLATDQDYLGVEIFADEKELPLNTWFDFTASNPPELSAAPITKSSDLVSTGDFSASATLSVDYQ